MKNIAIIPARSGSKGLKDKNIKELCGKPMMSYTIEAALQSGCFDVVHVSTDSERYAAIARSYGADVPFLRDITISGDNASSWEAIRFTLKEYAKIGEKYDIFTLLQPTSPLRNEAHIRGAMELYIKTSANAVVSVSETDHNPILTGMLPVDMNMKGFVRKEYRDVPRQRLPIYYRVNGAIYILKTELLNNIDDYFDNRCYAFKMEKIDSVDIDDEVDFLLAETILKSMRSKNHDDQ